MITSERVFKLVETFESILPYASKEDSLNMREAGISDRDPQRVKNCGTIHCHAGWYYLAKKWDRKSEFIDNEDSERNPYTGKSRQVDYRSGIKMMAKDVGDMRSEQLKQWASVNPALWGNCWGYWMFTYEAAFGDKKGETPSPLTLSHIVKHWEKVGYRLREKEQEATRSRI